MIAPLLYGLQELYCRLDGEQRSYPYCHQRSTISTF
jgi:hypothetical protein